MITSLMLRDALEAHEFFLEYLPTLSLADRRCLGAEALIRWRRPQGIIPPWEFIPVAENTPLSGLLTTWVIETVAAELGDWLRAHPDVHLSLNVPPEIIGRGIVEYAVGKAGLQAVQGQLIFEITERGLLDVVGIEGVERCRALGVRVALDDATLLDGAHLAILARAHFTVIKIDRSLTAQILEAVPAPAWLETVQALLVLSDLRVIAEGVETEYQARVLQAARFPAAQGFLFSRPLPAPRLLEFYQTCSNRSAA